MGADGKGPGRKGMIKVRQETVEPSKGRVCEEKEGRELVLTVYRNTQH